VPRVVVVQEENRALYNTVQDLRGDIRVFCRVRPLPCTDSHTAACVDVGAEGELALYDPEQRGRKEFRFGRVFDTASSQADVYADVQPLARSVLDGGCSCCLAAGMHAMGCCWLRAAMHRGRIVVLASEVCWPGCVPIGPAWHLQLAPLGSRMSSAPLQRIGCTSPSCTVAATAV
jgi:hypothetical protein